MLKDRLLRWFSRTIPDRGSHKIPETSVTLTTDIGLVRSENQDRVAVMRMTTKSVKPFTIIALVDGMGGMVNGTKCAVQAISTFFDGLSQFRQEPPRERLKMAADAANLETNKLFNGKGGTTLSALLLTPDHDPLILNVGDSRIYSTIDDGENIEVKRLTVDDSLEEAVGGHGKELIQFIGMGEGLQSHIEVVPKSVKRILITSDGIHFINQECLKEILLNAPDLIEASELLQTFARLRGAPDNASLAICDLDELNKSLSNCEDPGVELWDSFNSLHIMWTKEDSPKPKQLSILNNDKIVANKNTVQPKKKSSPKKKSPKNFKKDKTSPKEAPELSITTNPNPIEGEEK